jgi:hypothetical protein
MYVILSHTWGDGEVTFDDIDQPRARSMAGYKKIQRCCQQAMEDGFDYVWIDTCCIDKRSSAELSENINSMYAYYKKAEICYAVLSDVPSENALSNAGLKFRRSRWFSRGWTLQELLAPEIVEFYTSDWKFLGTKRSLVDFVETATSIPRDILHDLTGIDSVSTAQKFSWLSRRTTTREEDMAYCMLGIMGVNMPLLYGEGQKAFIRLQEELVKHSRDPTFLCWEHTSGMVVRGPFCGDPRAFRQGGRIYWSDPTGGVPFTVTNCGLEIQLPITQPFHDLCRYGYHDNDCIALPKCCLYSHDGYEYRVGIRLGKLNSRGKLRSQGYQRLYESKLELVPKKVAEIITEETMHICGLKIDHLKEIRTIEPVPVASIKVAGIHVRKGIPPPRFIAGGSIGSGETERFEHNPLAQCFAFPECYEIFQGKCVGILVNYTTSGTFIAFGLQKSNVWFTIRSGIDEKRMRNTLADAWLHRKIMITKKVESGTKVVDRTTLRADNGTMVTMSMRKKRNKSQGSTYWELNIIIEG